MPPFMSQVDKLQEAEEHVAQMREEAERAERSALTEDLRRSPLAATAERPHRVVSARRHGRKLRPGSHRANRFEIVVRDLQGDASSIDARLEAIATQGVPNYFGPQRFGREGNNLERALAWANGGAGPRDRGQRSFVLSAARRSLRNQWSARSSSSALRAFSLNRQCAAIPYSAVRCISRVRICISKSCFAGPNIVVCSDWYPFDFGWPT
jgi:hypothetical protein